MDDALQVTLLRRSTQDLFTSPGFMLHNFAARPDEGQGPAEQSPSTSGSSLPPHGINIALVIETYTALLQVIPAPT